MVAEGPDLVDQATEADLAGMDDVVGPCTAERAARRRLKHRASSLAEAGRGDPRFLKSAHPEPRDGAAVRELHRNRPALPRRWLPEIDAYLHYRSVDVSTVKELARRWYPEALTNAPKKAGAHRALDDILESVRELRTTGRPCSGPRTSRGSGCGCDM